MYKKVQNLHSLQYIVYLTRSEIAGVLLIDPAPDTLFEANTPSPSPPTPPPSSGTEQDEYLDIETRPVASPWTRHWYQNTVPHLQSLHMSGSLGFNRLGLMAGLMSPVELPELSNLLTDDIIAIKVGI